MIQTTGENGSPKAIKLCCPGVSVKLFWTTQVQDRAQMAAVHGIATTRDPHRLYRV